MEKDWGYKKKKKNKIGIFLQVSILRINLTANIQNFQNKVHFKKWKFVNKVQILMAKTTNAGNAVWL